MEIFLNGKSFRYPIEVELLSKIDKRDFKKLLKNISSYKWSLNPYTFEFVFTLSPVDFKYNEVWNGNL